MSEDLIGKLGRFTPSAAGIDRDAWLFRAGRASAPSPKWWRRSVGLLAVTQAVTLAAWLSRPAVGPVAGAPPAAAPATEPAEYEEPPPAPSGPLPPSSYLALARSDLTRPPRPDAGSGSSTTVHPTLTAGWRGGAIE